MSSAPQSSTPTDAARRALTIALTRASSPLAAGLMRGLLAEGDLVIGLDSEGAEQDRADWRTVDIGAPTVVSSLEDVDALVHLVWGHDLAADLDEPPAARRSRLLTEARTLVTAAAAAGVPHLVLVTSAMVFGARADNPVPIAEDSSVRASDTEGLVADLVAVEEEVRRVAPLHGGLRVTRMRPATVVGPGIDTLITRHFEAPRLLMVRGTVPAWSFCHVDDLASALLVVVHRRLADHLSVSARGWLSQNEVEELSGMRRIEVGESTAYAAARRLHRLGVVPVPATDLAYVSHPWVSEPGHLVGAGWEPVHDNAACLAVLLDEAQGRHAVMARRVRSRDAVSAAAAGAASAAVAVVATAALMRRRRSRG